MNESTSVAQLKDYAMPIFKHVLKRIALLLVGYILAVLIGLITLIVIYVVLSSLPGAPDYFAALALSPIVMIAVPPVGLLVLGLVYLLTAAQTLVAALFSEFFQLRNVVVHALFGTVVAVSAFVFASPTLVLDISATDWADIAIVGVSGLVAGVAYWLIAGRKAGFRPLPRQTSE